MFPKYPPVVQQAEVFLERIPDAAFREMIDLFVRQFHFQNGERMRIANYFVGISREMSDSFVQFIEEITQGIVNGDYPAFPIPDGFAPHPDNLIADELKGHFSFASFDMAVTEEGLQNIEFQAVATYPVSAAKLNQIMLRHRPDPKAYIFADDPATDWHDFITQYQQIISGLENEGVVLTDRFLKQQKTNFEFFATQNEIPGPLDIVDLEDIFERDGGLFYSKQGENRKIKRVYNRILLAEALFEDNYPHEAEVWKFRFDRHYDSLKFVNHPDKLYEVSKRLSPYIRHRFNPPCFELAEVAQDFREGKLKWEDYIWKHKWGGAGHRIVMAPNSQALDELEADLADYIAQKKVNFKIFKTDDGQEKIVELRFMTSIYEGKIIVVPMARLGHVVRGANGNDKFKIHFGDNNREGYGFSPVLIFQ